MTAEETPKVENCDIGLKQSVIGNSTVASSTSGVTDHLEENTGYVKPNSGPTVAENPRHMSLGSSFPTIVYQLRSLQLIALLVQVMIIYLISCM